jgi:hypothetical protein
MQNATRWRPVVINGEKIALADEGLRSLCRSRDSRHLHSIASTSPGDRLTEAIVELHALFVDLYFFPLLGRSLRLKKQERLGQANGLHR